MQTVTMKARVSSAGKFGESNPLLSLASARAMGIRARHGGLRSMTPNRRQGTWPLRAITAEKVELVSDLAASSSELHKPAQGSKYDWLHQWYPVAVQSDIDKSQPHSIELFGRRLVLWFDGKSWSCLKDSCPHRLAPLSEGRIETDGTLQCSYHGFRFNCKGSCTAIPQAQNTTAAVMNRCRVAGYPTAVKAGLIWVWPAGDTPTVPEPSMPEILEDGPYMDIAGGWLMRDMPYDFTTMMENILDPAHIMFAHHGLLGDRANAIPFGMRPSGELTLQGGFDMEVDSSSSKVKVADRVLSFQPPCYVQQLVSIKERPAAMYTSGYSVPLRPGWTRVFSTSRMKAGKSASMIQAVVKLIPPALLHMYTNEVLDGDLSLLHDQERNLQEAGGSAQAFFLPTQADRGVVLFRQWLEKLAGGYGKIPWAGGLGATLPPRETRKDVLLDRYSQHTCHCASCRKAYKVTASIKSVGTALAVGSVLAALWLIAFPMAAIGGVPPVKVLLILAAVSSLGAAAANALMPFFRFRDYVHHNR